MPATLDHARAARQAALRVERLLLEMLQAGERGDVRVEVTAAGLQPVVRKEERAPLIKVARGHVTHTETR